MSFVKSICCGFILTIYGGHVLFAQITPSYTNTEVITTDRYIRYQGNPYLFEKWMPSHVYGPDNKIIPQLKINYNAQNNQFEVMNPDGGIIVANEVLYNRVDIFQDGDTLTFSNKVIKGDINYYRVIYSGDKLAFLEKMEVSVKKDIDAEYSAYNYIGSFDKDLKNYIVKDGQRHEIFRNKNKILKFFDSDALKKYVKSERLNLNRDEDLVEAFRFMEKEAGRR